MADFEDGNGSSRFDGQLQPRIQSELPVLRNLFASTLA